MHVSEIWRYPVKSMRGQRVAESEVLRTGLAQDRRIVVLSNKTERPITARTHPALLGLHAALTEDGQTTVNGFMWNSPEVEALVSEAVRQSARLVDFRTRPDRFDVLPLLVATDGAIASIDIDSRRLRPNIIVGGVSGREEREWPGHTVQLGPVLIHAAQLRMRCVMTTYDPDTLVQDRSVLHRIVQQMQGALALDCSVVREGILRENDAVKLSV